MMIFEEITILLFTSDLFIQPGNNNPVINEGISESMISLYRGGGIFVSELPDRDTTRRAISLDPQLEYPIHGPYLNISNFIKNVDSIMSNDFAYLNPY